MPIVVDPGFVWPPEVDPVVSPDGRLTAIVDPAHAGVLLRADFDDSVPDTPAVPEKVLRRNLGIGPSGETSGRTWVVAAGGGSASGNRVAGGHSGGYQYEARWTAVGTTQPGFYYRDNWIEGTSGQAIAAGMWVKISAGRRVFIDVTARVMANGSIVGRHESPYVDTTGGWQWIRSQAFVTSGEYGYVSVQIKLDRADVGTVVAGDDVLVVREGTTAKANADVATYFNGSTAASGTKRYRWTGAPNESISEEYTPATPFIPGKPGTVAKVRFERQDGSVVRSGNPAWAPGGYAHAYDHEATLGGGTLWRAVPIRFDGTEGTPSEYVGAVIPALSDGWAWLKPVADPDKAMLLKVEPPDLSYDGRVDTTSIAGAPRPAATWDVLEGFTTQLRSLVREKNVEEQLMALLDEGPVLAQFPACAGLPDFYFIRGKLDLEHVHWDGWPWRRYQWDVIQIDRPDTTDSPLRIPGLSYDTVARDWTTYDQLKSTVESYNKLLEP